MPSPVGHALGAVAAGWAVAGAPRWPRRLPGGAAGTAVRSAAAFVLLGLAPDCDLLLGTHSTYTHSVGAVAAVGLGTAALGRRSGAGWRWGLAAAAAWASHILLDWLGTDGAAPVGIMALWPFTSDFYLAGWHVFPPVERRYWLPDFWTKTGTMLARELGILVPTLALVWWARHPSQRK